MSKPMMIKELIPTFFVQLEKRIVDAQGQLNFSFCHSCGSYVQPDLIQIVNGKPLCPECASNEDQSFEAKYDIQS